jgi:PAS domain S-box-containing protein
VSPDGTPRVASRSNDVASRSSDLASRLRSRALPWALVVLVVGLVISGAAQNAVVGIGQRNAQQLLNRRAAAAGAAVASELRLYQDSVTQVAAALGAQQISGAEFSAVTAALLSTHLAGASAVGFTVPATDAQLAPLQAYWRAHGAGRLTFAPAGHGEHYLPVLVRALDGGPTPATGRDAVSSPEFVEALQLARRTATTVVSEPHILLRDRSLPKARQQPSFTVVAPVFATGTADGQVSPNVRRGTFLGWISISLRTPTLASDTLGATTQGLVNVVLSAPTAGGRQMQTASLVTGPVSRAHLTDRVQVAVAQQKWTLTVQNTALSDSLEAGYTHLRQALALGGSAISVLLALLTWFVLSSRRRALERVDRATGELRVAEADARRQAVLVEAVMNSISDGVVVVDSAARPLMYNDASRRILGLGERPDGAARSGRDYRNYRPDGTVWPDSETPMGRALAGEVSDEVDMVVRTTDRPDGVRISVSARPLDAAAGVGGGGAVAVFHDVTVARQLQEQVQAEHDRYEHLLRVLSDLGEGVIIANDERFLFVNEAYATLTGWTIQELLARSPDVVAADANGENEFTEWRRRLDANPGSAATMFTHVRHRDGHVVPVETIGIRVSDQGAYQRVSVIRDLTERQRTEAELAERATALERANLELAAARDLATDASRAKSAFLATMSHEIRTPLNAVIGLTDLLIDTDLDHEQRDYLRTVHSSGETLLALINDVLDWSKIESGALDLEHRPFDLRDCVESAMDLVATQADGKNLDLLVQLDPECPSVVVGDVTRLRQILVNLLGNAVKFTEHGHVVITAGVTPTGSPDSEPVDTASPAAENALRLRFTVTDTGIGIAPDKVARLFHDFSQVDDSTTRTYGGTGLGLAISMRLAQAMDGSIAVRSETGIGSTFTVDIAVRTAGDQIVAASPIPAVLRGRRVLLVDNNAVNRQILVAQFADWGLDADAAASGDEALALLDSGSAYDLGVFDFRMPGMNGLELLDRIADLPGRAGLPVVLLTSMTNRATVPAGAAPGRPHASSSNRSAPQSCANASPTSSVTAPSTTRRSPTPRRALRWIRPTTRRGRTTQGSRTTRGMLATRGMLPTRRETGRARRSCSSRTTSSTGRWPS